MLRHFKSCCLLFSSTKESCSQEDKRGATRGERHQYCRAKFVWSGEGKHTCQNVYGCAAVEKVTPLRCTFSSIFQCWGTLTSNGLLLLYWSCAGFMFQAMPLFLSSCERGCSNLCRTLVGCLGFNIYTEETNDFGCSGIKPVTACICLCPFSA